jgi:hypothetical protein
MWGRSSRPRASRRRTEPRHGHAPAPAPPTSSSSSPTTSAMPTWAATAAGRRASAGLAGARRLAAGGLRFTQGYANSPVCSPTRFALMTGRYQYRLRGAAEEPINSAAAAAPRWACRPSTRRCPRCCAGRLPHGAGRQVAPGLPAALRPAASGYDDCSTGRCPAASTTSATAQRGAHDLYRRRRASDDGYLTDLITERARGRLSPGAWRRGGRALLPEPALHRAALALGDARRRPRWRRGQGQPVPPGRRQRPHLPPHDPPHGRGHRPLVMAALRGTASSDDTLVVFTSDNGGERFSDNWPLVGGKMDLTEGGIRVPWIAHWPAASRRRRQRAALPDDGLVGHDARRRRRRGRPGAPAGRRVAAAGAARPRAPSPADALAHEPPRPARAARRRWKYLRWTATTTCSTCRPTNASAPTGRPRARPAGARCARPGLDWNDTMPPIPATRR